MCRHGRGDQIPVAPGRRDTRYGWVRSRAMNAMDRRHFFRGVGIAVLGGSALAITGCSATDDAVAPTSTSADDTTTLLAGVSMKVHSDPG